MIAKFKLSDKNEFGLPDEDDDISAGISADDDDESGGGISVGPEDEGMDLKIVLDDDDDKY